MYPYRTWRKKFPLNTEPLDDEDGTPRESRSTFSGGDLTCVYERRSRQGTVRCAAEEGEMFNTQEHETKTSVQLIYFKKKTSKPQASAEVGGDVRNLLGTALDPLRYSGNVVRKRKFLSNAHPRQPSAALHAACTCRVLDVCEGMKRGIHDVSRERERGRNTAHAGTKVSIDLFNVQSCRATA